MAANCIMFLAVCVKLLLLMCGCLSYRVKKKPVAAGVLFLISLVCVCICEMQSKEYVTALFMLVTIPITFFALEGKNRGIFCVLGFFVISYIEELILVAVKRIASVAGGGIEEHRLSLLLSLISLILLGLLAVLLRVTMHRKQKRINEFLQIVNKGYVVLLAVGVAASALLAASFTSLKSGVDENNARHLAIYSFGFCVVFLIIGVLLMLNNQSKRDYMHMAKMNRKMLELNEKYYQSLLEKETETRRFRHDMSAHMVCLQGMLKENKVTEAEAYLKELSGSMAELKPKHQTGNTMVNAILNDIYGKYTGVMLDWDGLLPMQMQISDMDVCVIFSNLLENAFLAASACEESGKVNVTVDAVAGALKVVVQNDMAKPIEEKEGKFLTQKADRSNHGFGIMNVKQCVADNGGKIVFDYTETSFTAKLILPNVI